MSHHGDTHNQPPVHKAPPQPATYAQQPAAGGACPACNKGQLVSARRCTVWTWIVACWCTCGLCCDCAWGRKMVCVSCGHTVNL